MHNKLDLANSARYKPWKIQTFARYKLCKILYYKVQTVCHKPNCRVIAVD